ncbi:hypothetical protein [Streptomyces sp. NPDC056244]|uniref:hypothetical protein n=1 Tax=Streptomyces sp. NPDC056244 TaxID=3345762 RepID=UPI0035DA9A12
MARAMGEQMPEPMPSAAQMRGYVSSVVRALTARNRLPLDYTVASLRVVDFIIEGLRSGGPARGQVTETLRGLGAYVGEVLVRRAGAVWVDFDDDQRAMFGQSVGVRLPDGRVWNPLGRVVNRFVVGPEESLETFYLRLHGRSSGLGAAERPARREGTDGGPPVDPSGGPSAGPSDGPPVRSAAWWR